MPASDAPALLLDGEDRLEVGRSKSEIQLDLRQGLLGDHIWDRFYERHHGLAVGKEVSADRAPHVKVRIDDTWHDDHSRSINDLGTLSGQVGPNICNEPVTHKHVRFWKSAERRIDRNDSTTFDEIVPREIELFSAVINPLQDYCSVS
jgi:hypothetical protein